MKPIHLALPALSVSLFLALPATATSESPAPPQTDAPTLQPASLAERPALPHGSLAERLCSIYSQIQSVSCEIRKTTKSGLRTMRMLSRVHYRAPNHIHVDNVAPVKRTIIADGERLYYHETGAKRGFSRPIGELSETWLASLRNIPGTPVEHLLPLRGVPSRALPASDDGHAREAYEQDNVYVVLTADAENRLQRIDFYKSPAMQAKTGEYTFSHFREALPGCWIPTQHKATLFLPADEVVVETRRIGNLAVNGDIPGHLFNHELFFEGVEFVADFEKTYK